MQNVPDLFKYRLPEARGSVAQRASRPPSAPSGSPHPADRRFVPSTDLGELPCRESRRVRVDLLNLRKPLLQGARLLRIPVGLADGRDDEIRGALIPLDLAIFFQRVQRMSMRLALDGSGSPCIEETSATY